MSESSREDRWARPIAVSDFDWNQPAQHHLPPGAVATLLFMRSIEGATDYYLRLMRTAIAAKDAQITNYLDNWIIEETAHAELLAEYLVVRGYWTSAERRSWLKRFRLRLNTLVMHLGSSAIGEASIAVHTTWGFINERTTKLSYLRMAELHGDSDPLLAEILREIAKQEGKHEGLNLIQARNRLTVSEQTQAITRWTLTKFWAPVGEGYEPRTKSQAAICHMFPPNDPATTTVIEKIDGGLDRLPGLAGLRLMEKAIVAAHQGLVPVG